MKSKWMMAAMLMAMMGGAQAKNPGEDASHCVRTRSADGRVYFTNTCDTKIFVLWCGDLTYSNKRCGDGPKGGFYTHSNNIESGRTYETAIKGRYSYAACVGGISFGNSGEYEDFPNGGYRCLPR